MELSSLAPCLLRSYPTYEEWKHNRELIKEELNNSSYPTYEEWKLVIFHC